MDILYLKSNVSYSEITRWFNSRIFVKDNHKNEHFYAIIILFDF